MSSSDSQEKLDDVKFAPPTVDVLDASDDGFLEQMGYKQEFRRDFTFLGLFSLVSSELAILPGVAGTIWCALSFMPSLLVAFSNFQGTRWDTWALWE